MSETTRVVIPYESMDPLAIGATDDESKKHRDTLELDIPTANLPSSSPMPDPIDDLTAAARDWRSASRRAAPRSRSSSWARRALRS